jgi:hypothetical protein
MVRFIVALLALLASTAAMAQQRTYQDSMGRNTGRSVTDGRGNSTFYDAMGRNTGRSVTNGNTTTTYDNLVVARAASAGDLVPVLLALPADRLQVA